METAIEYRNLAARFEQEAIAAALPCVRELKLRAARRWEVLADELEVVVRGGNFSNQAGWIY